MSKFERKFGRYAIPNLSLILVMCYAAGYLLQLISPTFLGYLSLDPYQILHGQVWRLFTWIISPPSSLDVFTLLLLFAYYSFGTGLEHAWGTYQYNVYILGGMLITVVAAFATMGVCYLLFGETLSGGSAAGFFYIGSQMFSTYYINMSIFLAYAATYPENRVLFMFLIPIRVKWLGLAYLIYLVYVMIQYFMLGIQIHPAYWFAVVAIGASLVNFFIFWLKTRHLGHLAPKQIKRRAEFKHQVKEGVKLSGHRCSICGRTEQDNPNLEFRYCSKCKGSHEYCQEHLFTHVHKDS